MKISVVVPAYNVKNYLEKCIGSLVNQTFSDYEIIIVDDGSTDGTSDLCDELAIKNSRIVVFHKENGGLSDARNFGIDKSQGEYITFVDSDDYVAPVYLEWLYKPVEKCGAEVSATSLLPFFENETPIFDGEVEYTVVSVEEAVRKMLLRESITHSAGGKLYKRELWKDICFPVGLLYEDYLTTFFVMKKAKMVGITTPSLYYYLQRQDSIMHYKCNEKTVKIIEATKQVTPKIVSEWPQLKTEALDLQVALCLKCMQHILNEKPNDFIEEQGEIKRIVKNSMGNLLFSKKTPIKDKIKVVSFLFGKKIFLKIYNMFSGN